MEKMGITGVRPPRGCLRFPPCSPRSPCEILRLSHYRKSRTELFSSHPIFTRAGSPPIVARMKRGKRRKRGSSVHSKHKHPHEHAPVADRRIVPVDDGPLRKRAGAEFSRAMAKLEKARAELQRYEQEDGPAFGRWVAATFGALLTEIRENARLVRERQALIDEVEMEMIWSGHRNPRKAYAAVMKRRGNPGKDDGFDERPGEEAREGRGPDGEEDESFDSYEEMAAGIPQEEREELFDDFVRTVMGVNPEHMSKAEYARMFAAFEAEMFGKDQQAGPPQVHEAKKPAANPEEARIKEIYRTLVRRLHPDLRADGDATVSAMWHEVQEAYEAGNLDRLETLLALTEMESGSAGGQASLSQVRLALAEINRAFRTIQRSLGAAKRDPAWGFSRNPYRGATEKRVRHEMEQSLSEQRLLLSDLERIIDDFSRPWHPPVRKPRKRSGQPEKPKAGPRMEESNIPRQVQTIFAF